MSSSYFNDIIGTIVERGRAIIEGGRGRRGHGDDITGMAEALVAGRGEASGTALAQDILDSYAELGEEAKTAFFRALAEGFGPDEEALSDAAREYLDSPDEASALRLHFASEPRRQELVRRLNRAPGGTARLVAMREDLIGRLPENPDLARVDRDFQHLLSSWFNRGFLVLRRIDWSTPAVILEKIIRYEAVHAINGWDDLRRRIDPADRRLYAFFHPALVDDPLIFVEVALTGDIPAGIQPILAEDRPALDPSEATTAVFYSISNCQIGLRGISFGNFLIKQVVEELARAFPNLRTFVTLSPVPTFARWLDREQRAEAPEALLESDGKPLEILDRRDWHLDPKAVETVRPTLMALAAHYFLRARNSRGGPADPVANFHLGNGARLERINFLGDPSPKGLKEGHGLMVNYLYDLRQIERNHESFVNEGEIVAAPGVRRLLRPVSERRSLVAANE